MTASRSLRNNSIANYLGAGYIALISLGILPLYLKYLGPEGFGLVGVFTMLQSWSQLLDMGMSPLLSRQAARARSENRGFESLRRVLRSLEIIAFLLMVLIIAMFSVASPWLASDWFEAHQLQSRDVILSLILMACALAVRMPTHLYRGGIRGLERQVLLNVLSVSIISLRYLGALALLHFISIDIVVFFAFQLLVSVIELICSTLVMYRLTMVNSLIRLQIYWKELRPLVPFAGGIAYVGVLWVLLVQVDRVVLSSVLPLSEFGYFSLVAVLYLGITQLAGPISQAILPRLTYLVHKDEQSALIDLYRKATQWSAALVLPVAGILALYGAEVIYAWTGSIEASDWSAPIIPWFAAGSGIMVLSAFQYHLQYAFGQLRLHVIFSTVTAMVMIPLIIMVALHYGALGVAIAWFVYRTLVFLFWTPVVHSRFVPGVHLRWLGLDIAPVAICTLVLLFISSYVGELVMASGRVETLAFLGSIGVLMVGVNLLLAPKPREMVVHQIASLLGR